MKSPKIAIVALGIAGLASAMPPWWLDRGVLDTNAPPNDFAIANQGQAKWIAHQAREMFDATLPGGAGPAVSDLLAGFGPTNNHWPLNIGQLKTLADPFYARLAELGWTNAFPEGMQGSRPWTATAADDNDFAMVNLGQLKYVFSFDPEPLLMLDTDGDSIPDAWETALGLDPHDPSDALAISSHPYANGLTNLQVFENPGVLLGADFSTLGDGIPDWWKVLHGFDISDPDVAGDDPDGDGWTNLDEYLRGSDPFHDDRVSLMVDGADHFQFKYGFQDWATTNPPPRIYLVQVVTYTNGATTTETIDPLTGDQVSYVVSGSGFSGPASYSLDSEHTTAMLKANTATGLDAKEYTGVYYGSDGNFMAWIWLCDLEGDEEMLIDAGKARYKFNLDTAQTNGALSWVEIFTPQDDWTTPGVDESTNVVHTVRSTPLSGQPESPEFEINPFEANDGGYGYYSIAILKVDTETVATIPADRTRKKVGLGEEVELSLEPSSLSPVTWSISGNGTLSATNGNPITFTAYDQASTPTVTATYGGTPCAVTFNVVEPSHETAVKQGPDYSYPPGVQGAGMYLEVTVHPTDVSFANVEFREVSGPATGHSGYFLQWGDPQGLPYHYAGVWQLLSFDNKWYDEAFFYQMPSPWSAGVFQWVIPMEWRVIGSSHIGNLPDRIHDSTIHGTNGMSSVSKLGQSATRTP